MIELRVPCSPDQEDVIADHLLNGTALGMQPDERAWIIAQTRKVYPTGRVTAADLDVGEAEWVIQVQLTA